jgi:hypothetical protein
LRRYSPLSVSTISTGQISSRRAISRSTFTFGSASPQRQLRPETAPEGVYSPTRTNISANTAAMPSQARMIWVRPPRFGLSDAWSVSIKNAPRQWPGLRETEGYHALSSNIMQRAPAEAPSHNPPPSSRSFGVGCLPSSTRRHRQRIAIRQRERSVF